MSTKVILRADLQGLGKRGDIVDVADGYARNFLLPNGHAFTATNGAVSQAGAMRRARDLRDAHAGKCGPVTARNGVGGVGLRGDDVRHPVARHGAACVPVDDACLDVLRYRRA